MFEKIKRWARLWYLKLFRINDSPLKVALGFALGAFVGVMPGVGPVAALVLAVFFRVNRVSALLGSLLFNTWMGLVALVLAVKVGALVMGRDQQVVQAAWSAIFRDFKWEKLSAVPIYDVLLPIGVGYFIVSFCFAALAGTAVYALMVQIRRQKKTGG
ncbi:MAG: DUF2062 domain-containing protein [Candidatus Omnitrophica bacterium]|nr:DUF2062 domain-containing protein [Candidatus Omnitrophota bacterium]